MSTTEKKRRRTKMEKEELRTVPQEQPPIHEGESETDATIDIEIPVVYTVREVSVMAKIGQAAVRELVRRGVLRQCSFPGVNVLRITSDSVRKLLSGEPR